MLPLPHGNSRGLFDNKDAMSSLRFAFEKYVATGNDFVLVDLPAESQTLDDATLQAYQHLAQRVCHRRFGIGADGILLVDHHPSWREERGYDTDVAIINPDGSIAQMCGNGMRCVARFMQAKRHHTSPFQEFRINTLAGIQVARIAGRLIEIDMAQASLGDSWTYTCYDGYAFDGRCVNLGNPHFVIIVEEEDMVPHDLARRYGHRIAEDPYFREGTNVEFIRPLSRDTLAMAVYERGCGVTLSCGTGAVASAAVWASKYPSPQITIQAEGGTLVIHIPQAEGEKFTLAGDAGRRFSGKW